MDFWGTIRIFWGDIMNKKELENWLKAIAEAQQAGFKAAKEFIKNWKPPKAFYIDRNGKKTEIK